MILDQVQNTETTSAYEWYLGMELLSKLDDAPLGSNSLNLNLLDLKPVGEPGFDSITDLVSNNRVIDAAVSSSWWPDAAIFFRGDKYFNYYFSSGTTSNLRELSSWGVPWSSVDAAFWCDRYAGPHVYFMKGNKYMYYNVKSGYVGPVRTIMDGWSIPWSSVDAAFYDYNYWGGKIYFFKGNKYLAYTINGGSISEERSLNAWPSAGRAFNNIDGVLLQPNYAKRVYFFSGD